MPIKKPESPYKPLFGHYICCECYDTLEYNTMVYDLDTLQYWDLCKNCEEYWEAYPYTDSKYRIKPCQLDLNYEEYMKEQEILNV